ncbi:MAG TPA: Rieske (2Fe-2S) protein [Candidatus Dormibacteraeota bacterium]|nr:Rieske (2Fe-2S) protein [Candidatus Dormibacteraeota bacterium]
MTDSPADRVARFVDDLLHGRRPRRFDASQEEVEAMTAAAGLASARVGADLPSKAALDRIHGRLAAALDESPALDRHVTRRMLLRTFGTAAAAMVIGVGLDEVATRQGKAPDQTGGGGGSTVLMPDGGAWKPVASVTQLPAGHAMTVSTGAIDAVIVNEGGSISAVSGICTHLGCRLQPDDAGKKLDCPCHQTAFGWTGKVLYYRLKAEPANLPKIPSRVNGDQIELFVV